MTATEQRAPRGRRAPGRERGGGGASKVVSAVVGIALAAAAVWLQTVGLSAEEMNRPLASVGDKGEEVATGRFSVRVDGVKTAKSVRAGDETAVTENVFLVVETSATVPQEPIKIRPPVLVAEDGRHFDTSDKVDRSKTLANPWTQPGWWSSGVFVFDVPADALRGAKASFVAPTNAFYGEPMLPAAEVDLGIDEAAAKQLGSAPQDVYTVTEKK
ncbi:hypothetical protein ACIBEJ_18185 [Nonomuraea sp. NPDC050790]|uniref:hypothetical protein n=1 Tax=Nonomuraea sp. NPDC050790 TaxID=3364371 RepID=UPI0037B681C2